MRDMSQQEEQHRGERMSSSDILFPEEPPWGIFDGDVPYPPAPVFNGDNPGPPAPYCSLYPNEQGYRMDPPFNYPPEIRHLVDQTDMTGSVDTLRTGDMKDTLHVGDKKETLYVGDITESVYAVPLTANCPARLRRACIDTFLDPHWRKHFAERRKTWSPPTFERVMANAGDFLAMRSCYSNDQLTSDAPSNDEPEMKAPPKLAPVSGILSSNTHVIKPIAFRPVLTLQSKRMTQQQVNERMTQRHISEHMTQRHVNGHTAQRHNMTQCQNSPLPFCQRSPCLSQASPDVSNMSRRMSHTSSQPSPRLSQPSPRQFQPSPHLVTHSTHPRPSPHMPHVSPHSVTRRTMYYSASPRQQIVTRSANHSQDDGYMSQEYHNDSHNYSNSNNDSNHSNSNHNDSNHSDTNHNDLNHSDSNHSDSNVSAGSLQRQCRGNYRSDSLTSSNLSGVSTSPSDSGVGELETLLRVKDDVIDQLRDTMARNETAIIETYTQKQQNWSVHLQQVHAEWQRRLRAEQRHAYETEQTLLQQLAQLRQDSDASLRRRVSQERNDASEPMDRVKRQLQVVTELYERTKRELETTRRQLSHLRQDIAVRGSGGERVKCGQLENGKGGERVRRGQLENSNGGERVKPVPLENGGEMVKDELRENGGGGETVKRSLLVAAETEIARLRSVLAHEREQWLDEKNKVVRYQKHLQLNYVQMYRKNQSLEAEVEQLTLELENRHIVDATAIAASVDNDKLMVTNLATPMDESSC